MQLEPRTQAPPHVEEPGYEAMVTYVRLDCPSLVTLHTFSAFFLPLLCTHFLLPPLTRHIPPPLSNLRLRDWGRTEYRIVRNWTPREVREARNIVPPPPSSLARVSQQIHQEEEEEDESPLIKDQGAKQVGVIS